jgi:tetratricopeptide (TPR) repeat protein
MATTTNANSIVEPSTNTIDTTQLSKGVGTKPSNDFLMPYNKGAALLNLGKYNESIAYFDKALAINPKYIVSLYNKGAALNKLEKYNESIAYFDKVLAIKPTNNHALAGKKLDLAALGIPQDPSMFGFYFGPTNTTAIPTNAHNQH